MKITQIGLLIAICTITSCKKESQNNLSPTPEPRLIFKFKFDATQDRLGSNGQLISVPAGNGAQSPIFNKMSANYIELSPVATTALGAGKVLYRAPERTLPTMDKAIEFSQSNPVGEGETLFSLPLKEAIGTYAYLRLSLAYQNYNIQFRVTVAGQTTDQTSTIASFIGYRTYIESVKVKNQTLAVNDAKLQGFWAFENPLTNTINFGQAPQGATTVPNPLFATSPIPAGSCVVTGAFLDNNLITPLVITGTETNDITIQVSLSTNQSFEWTDTNPNGKWEPLLNEPVVDMGIRGMKPFIQK